MFVRRLRVPVRPLFLSMVSQKSVQMFELLDVSVNLVTMMDRSSAMALYTMHTGSWKTFCEIPGARFCFVLEWVFDKIQLINDEYVETLIACGVVDECMCLLDMAEYQLHGLAFCCKVLFDAYQHLRNQACVIAPVLSQLRVAEIQ